MRIIQERKSAGSHDWLRIGVAKVIELSSGLSKCVMMLVLIRQETEGIYGFRGKDKCQKTSKEGQPGSH